MCVVFCLRSTAWIEQLLSVGCEIEKKWTVGKTRFVYVSKSCHDFDDGGQRVCCEPCIPNYTQIHNNHQLKKAHLVLCAPFFGRVLVLGRQVGRWNSRVSGKNGYILL